MPALYMSDHLRAVRVHARSTFPENQSNENAGTGRSYSGNYNIYSSTVNTADVSYYSE